ncbi:MAG: cytochrome c [Campylobacterales bacterium]
MRLTALLFLLLGKGALIGEESFINRFEYGEMLYRNPRGIGCDKCHGLFGEGRELGRYEKKGKQIVIVAPRIDKLDVAAMKAGLAKRNKFMPTYYLTDQEIATLVYYLKHAKERS